MKNLTTAQKLIFFVIVPLLMLVIILAAGVGSYLYVQNSKSAETVSKTTVKTAGTNSSNLDEGAQKKTLYGTGSYKVGDEIAPGSYYMIVKSGEDVWLDSPEWESLEKDNPYRINLRSGDEVEISTYGDENVEVQLVPVDEYKPSSSSTKSSSSTSKSSSDEKELTKAEVEEFAKGLVGKNSKLAQELVNDFNSEYDDAYVSIDAVDSEGNFASAYDSGLKISEVTSVSDDGDDMFTINVVVVKE